MIRRVVVLVIVVTVLAACSATMVPDTSVPGSDPNTPTSQPNAPRSKPIALSASPGVERVDPAPDAPVGELTAGLNDAGFELWKTQPLEANLVFSPASIGNTLLMARAAADEPTREAIDTALSLPAGRPAHEAWNKTEHAMADSVTRQPELTLAFADRMWPRLDIDPDQEWIDLLASEHGVTNEALDFNGDPEGSRQRINSWVSEQTEGLIPDLLPDDFITPDRTVLVLTDAVYFKAQWATIFGKYESVEDWFTRPDGTQVNTEFMRELELSDRRGVGDGYVGAEIPYVGGDFSMLVIVPDQGRFEELRQRLGQDLLDTIDASFTTGPYELLLPKWETTTDFDLIDWLTDIGAAPGRYPAIGPQVFLDAAVHGADIAVDEWGTVAAAATAFGFAESGPPEPELTVKADRPFLYVIRHRPTGLVLFAGQVTDPTE